MKHLLSSAVAVAALSAAAPASAATFVVDAKANSWSTGNAVSTFLLAAGQLFTVSSSTDDLWAARPEMRWSDANGLIATRYKTAADDASGMSVGDQIAFKMPMLTRDGFTAPYGSLVGRIGSTYMLLGANGSFVAPTAGVLDLFYWDSNSLNNSGSIAFDISTGLGAGVPEPATWGMLILGFGAIGAGLRRRTTKVRYA